jgi:hypothetical protein
MTKAQLRTELAEAQRQLDEARALLAQAAVELERIADEIGCSAGHWDGGSIAECEHCQMRGFADTLRKG